MSDPLSRLAATALFGSRSSKASGPIVTCTPGSQASRRKIMDPPGILT
jgi:hypothetical protein